MQPESRFVDETILLVEDDPDDRELALLAFAQTKLGSRVDTCEDAQQALDYLFCAREAGEQPQRKMPKLILLDLKMPKIGGIEVLKQIRANPKTRLLPVVMLTSSLEERDLIESYANCANGYVRKPVDFLEFVETARQIGLYWLGLNETLPGNAS